MGTAENRLEYQNHRFRKQVFDWTRTRPAPGGWADTPSTYRKFVWYNWLLLAELDGEDDSVLKKYTWGPDLAGQHGQPGSLESAGGIGGLLATRDEVLAKSYVHFYDANGNTGQLILRADGSTAAAYEYDAYGNVAVSSGSCADDNTWRFSTKQWDDETGLGYWGERWYDSGEGRWLSRDPLEEAGGNSLYAYAFNSPVEMVDAHGRQAGPPGVGSGAPGQNGCKPAKRDCSDCWKTCTSAAGQGALGTDDAGVICRPDGCRCACVNTGKYPGGMPGSPEEILKSCTLKHEEEHVDQGGGWCHPCRDSSFGGGLKRQRTREICDPDKDECAGYGAELRCLAKALRNGSCSDVECERRVRDALYSVLLQQCNQYCKARSAYNDVADVLTPMQRRLAKQACAPPPGPADIDMNY